MPGPPPEITILLDLGGLGTGFQCTVRAETWLELGTTHISYPYWLHNEFESHCLKGICGPPSLYPHPVLLDLWVPSQAGTWNHRVKSL